MEGVADLLANRKPQKKTIRWEHSGPDRTDAILQASNRPIVSTYRLFLRLAICQQVCNTLHSAEVHSTNARYDNKLKTDRISDHSFPVCGPHCWSSGTEIGSHPHKAGEFNTKMSIAINELATRLADMTRGLRATYLLLEKLDQDIRALKSQAP